jgi:hypothetical protein
MVLLAVPLVVLLAFGILARMQLARIEERSRFVADTRLASVAALGGISASVAELRVSIRALLLATDPMEEARPAPHSRRTIGRCRNCCRSTRSPTSPTSGDGSCSGTSAS